MAGNIVLFMTLIMMVLKGNENPVPVGLRVRLLRPGTRFQSISGMQAVLVEMKSEANNLPPDIYLGSRRVPWDDFEATLQTEINRRPPDWPVYLEGDRESDWASVVRAIDRIRRLHVDVILLTHKRDSSGPQK